MQILNFNRLLRLIWLYILNILYSKRIFWKKNNSIIIINFEIKNANNLSFVIQILVICKFPNISHYTFGHVKAKACKRIVWIAGYFSRSLYNTYPSAPIVSGHFRGCVERRNLSEDRVNEWVSGRTIDGREECGGGSRFESGHRNGSDLASASSDR